MSKVAVVYWSGTGNTRAMADLVQEGAASAGASADLFVAGEFTAEQAKEYAALALGCPAMGAEELEDSEFDPMYQAVKPELGGKAVALFGSYGWGDGEWIRTWAEDCEAAGCRMITEPLAVNGSPEGPDAEACRALGKALAQA